ncbi:MAG TPA: efflux RND transporter permease subunit, partial [Polyangiales bacterium]|nr:efflux RND transporter permease subunit [Polyangiales bacterium]
MDQVEHDIVFGGAMAVLIILVFMLDLRSMLISALALPTSVVATFFVMYMLGFTLNMMTLLGLSLAIGLLIDDAVVVRENIFKHLERGVAPKQAALDGTKEIALAVLATTLTVVAVFAPVAFMGGMVGQFFKQFGLTVSAAVLVSLFVAFTLDPMLSSRFSKPIDHSKKDRWMWLKRPFLAFFAGMDALYAGALGFVVRNKLVTLFAAVVAFGGMLQITKVLGADFVAPQDRGQFNVDIELPAGTSLDETVRQNAKLVEELRKDKLVTTVLAKAGANGDANRIAWRVITVPKQARSVPIQVIQDRTRQVVGALEGAKTAISDVQMIEGAGFQAPIMINVRGPDYEQLDKLTQQVVGTLRTIPGVADVDRKYSPGKSELQVSIDRGKAADLGLPVAAVAGALRTALEGDDTSKLRQGDDEIPIRVRLREEDRKTEQNVLDVSLAGPKGVVTLADVAQLRRGEGPQEITREDRERQIQIWAAPHGRSLGDVAGDMQKKLSKIDFPPGYS